jgi:hypothetical protein
MRGLNRQGVIQRWGRLALKCGLLLTDAKLWESIGGQLRDHANDVTDGVRERYEDTTDRLLRARDAYQGRRDWVTPTVSFVGGVGLGAGIALLLAPSSGEETRSVIRDKVVDLKNRVQEAATESTPYRAAVRATQTGTD